MSMVEMIGKRSITLPMHDYELPCFSLFSKHPLDKYNQTLYHSLLGFVPGKDVKMGYPKG